MNQATNFAEDAQLTAYALGELDGEERAAVEARLHDDAAARMAVEAIRATAVRVEAALADEAAPLTSREGRMTTVKPSEYHSSEKRSWRRLRLGQLKRSEAFYYLAGSVAAAAVAVLIAFRPTVPLKAPRNAAQTDAMQKREVPATLALPVAEPAAGSTRAFENEDLSLLAQVQAPRANTFAAPAALGVLPAIRDGAVGGTIGHPARREAAAEHFRYAVKNAVLRSEGPEWGRGYLEAAVAEVARVRGRQAFNTEAYGFRAENAFLEAGENPLSTFSADVDTASYANVRRFIEGGAHPPVDAVRIEELVNYFPYRYVPPPAGSAAPFAATMEVAEAPWAPGHRLVRIGLKGREVAAAERAPANLVFLLDVSGSMNAPNKLPLVKTSLRLLLGRLRPDDRVAIVTYAGASGLTLPSTPVAKVHEIEAALDELQPGGSTNGAMGIQLAYDIAKANFASGGINRVVLCTDGDFNVGVTSEGELVRLIREKAKTGVFLTVLGFGMGNYQDARLQQLADAGNGNYGYIDTSREAEKLLVEQVSGTLVTIAKDVKLQVEFNPATVARYRLIGYEKRLLKQEEFNDDKVDAGEIGSGHTVTALYEIVPVGAADAGGSSAGVDELKYRKVEIPKAKGQTPKDEPRGTEGELLTLKVHYKEPAGEVSRKLEFPLTDGGARFERASEDFKFAAAVVAFGMVLRDSPHKGSATLAQVATWAEAGASADPGGYRAEFVALVKKAAALP